MSDNTPITEDGARGAHALPTGTNHGARGACALPSRKALDHRGPISIDIAGAWYFVTICAKDHDPWSVEDKTVMRRAWSVRHTDEHDDGRAVAPRPPSDTPGGRAVAPRPPDDTPNGRAVAPRPPFFDAIAPILLHEARESHLRGLWQLALFLVMPDHLHMIVHVPSVCGGRGATALPNVIAKFKHLLSSRYGLRFQRDFFDTRLRDNEHYGEKFRYICSNPVRKGLCETPRDWPHVIAFDRETGEEKQHR